MSHKLPLADIQFLSDFHAYCLTRGDEKYDYDSNEECAAAQFLMASGRAIAPCVGGDAYHETADDNWPEYQMPAGIDQELSACGHTFSALATRLEALLTDVPVVERVS